jgi:amino acid adenylation domain-containing protein
MSSLDSFETEIAIIGMAGRFPRAKNLEEFWRNLRDGVEAVTFFTDEELLAAGVSAAALDDPRCVKARNVLEDVELFDAAFFNYQPREAEVMDPQHRFFLECAWEALENAGYDPGTFDGRIGVFGGESINTYLQNNINLNQKVRDLIGFYQIRVGNRLDNLTTRVAYKLNLRGPSVTLQTACSTSLVAVHFACQSLLNHECDMALAGGVAIHVPQKSVYLYQEGGIGSKDGHCRAFDREATGFVGGNGVGLVTLKRLRDALEDGDAIHAVIKGSAVNNDGSAKVGYTAPSLDGQAEVISEAIAMAGVEPETITCIEAHGTGTPLGDPIELGALAQVFGASTEKRGFCAVGSVKTNIGHLDTAAGVAGLIKAALALQHRLLPPSLNFTQPNPGIDFENSPFYVNSQLGEWKTDAGPRRCGVSSFGIGGTNAHVIVEEPPAREPSGEGARPYNLLLLSAKSDAALEKATTNLLEHLKSRPASDFADVAYTLQVGRRPFACRRAVVCRDSADAIDALETYDSKRMMTSRFEDGDPSVAFAFPGQGAQYVKMGAGLYGGEREFRRHFDECAESLIPALGLDIRSVVYPADEQAAEAAIQLDQTFITQPALFAFEYSLAMQWMAWGISPTAMIGHSIGEYVAACLAGVLSLEDALGLVAARGRLMQGIPRGAMLSVALPETEVEAVIGEDLSLAAVNGPFRCVVAGETEAVEELERGLTRKGVECRRLRTSHAFHSRMVEPIVGQFAGLVESIALKPPRIPYISNVTGRWITDAEATDPAYWGRHLRRTVRFTDGVKELLKSDNRLLLEVGPGRVLSGLTQQHAAPGSKRVVFPSLPHAPESGADVQSMLTCAAQLWLAGIKFDWRGFHAGSRRLRVGLPTYPFEAKRYWIEPEERPAADGARTPGTHTTQGALENFSDEAFIPDARETEEDFMSQPSPPAMTGESSRRSAVLSALKAAVKDLTGLESQDIDSHATFFELGFDSLLLMRVSQKIQNQFGVVVAFRQLFEEFSTLGALATYLDGVLPPTATLPDAARETPNNGASASPLPLSAQASPLDSAVRELAGQLSGSARQDEHVVTSVARLMTRQLELLQSVLGQHGAGVSSSEGRTPPPVAVPAQAAAAPSVGDAQAFGPWRPVSGGAATDITARQQKHVEQLAARYTSRTSQSKKLAQAHRHVLADNRAAVGFRQLWKEMVYPITSVRSEGARLWDVDGNEYVDFVMGFGVYLFGHSPSFVTRAVEEQLRQGIEIGSQTRLAGEAGALISELTGMERVTFCNTGSEAVMGALRLARTVTGRDKIALFTGSYHGISDGVLARVREVNGARRSVPVAPGIPQSMVEDIVALDYDSPASLDYLREHARELAAVLVEPVQSRRPDLQPMAFLHELREITERNSTALIFDEMISGFRAHPGGAQALFGVQADIATYGKIIGGGMPIGVVAGKAAFMDAVDGGMWDYGDASYPRANQTFFAGTFSKHPLVLAAALATLKHLKASGPPLQHRLNQRTEELVAHLNEHFRQTRVPIHLASFSSFFRFVFPPEARYASLLFYHLLERGIYIWEGRTWFLSTEHSDDDIAFLTHAIKESVGLMKQDGFFPDAPPPTPAGSPFRARAAAGDGLNSSPAAEDAAPPAPVSPAADETSTDVRRIPLTEAQKDLWVVTQLGDEASRSYNESSSLYINGPLDVTALCEAIQEVVNRHEALRTTFSADGDYQLIHPTLAVDVPLADFSHLDSLTRETQLGEWLAAEVQQPFDLTQWPLVRFRLVKLDEQRHVLTRTMHHIIGDGWSAGIILRELSALYTAKTQGIARQLPTPVQFSEYVELQERERLGPRRAASEAFWTEKFADGGPALELPTDHARPRVQTHKGARERLTLGEELCDELKSLSRSQGCTLFVTALAAFKVLLHRLSGQNDIVVGIPSAGQAAMNNAYLVGYCINLLPIRSRLAADITFSDYLADVRAEVVNAFEHRNYPYSKLVEKSELTRDVSRAPIVSVIFNLDKSASRINFAGLEAEVASNAPSSAKFEIYLNISEKEDKLLLEWDYNTDLFEPTTMRRWMAHYRTLLEGAAADPARPVSALPLLTEDERRQLLVEWNDTAADYGDALCLHQLFEAQAARTPDAIALDFEGEQLTYAGLNGRANQLARHLRARGVRQEVSVGVLLERSPEMVIALLGVLKAGGAYVPLDPGYPKERLGFMLEDARAGLLVAQRGLLARLPDRACEVVCLDAEGEFVAAQDASNLDLHVSPSNLAYVIFTSGSTGRPKGAMNEHRGIHNRLVWMQQAYRLDESDRVLQKTPFSFDVSVWEFFWPLMTGARLVIARPEGHRDNAYLAGLIASQGITTVHFVPSMLQAFLEEPGARECVSLRRVICSGEELAYELTERFHALSEAELHNLYGPTEAAVDVTFWRCERGGVRKLVPIGRPIANTRIYLLDESSAPQPIGLAGELHIGGAGVGRGYLNRPGLTAERFTPDPFGGRPGARLYRTGDVARHLPGGEVEFLGRRDGQVKVRGYRVELREVEKVLREQAGVREAAVVAQTLPSGDKQLVAYVAAAGDERPVAGRLRSMLKDKLPDYMLPAFYVVLDALPLSPNGKVDRRALPPPERTADESETPYVSPRTAVEEVLADIWRKVLHLDRVGVNDNFFELGGHSLLATKVMTRARESFQTPLTLRHILENPTVASFANAIIAQETKPGRAEKIARTIKKIESLSAAHVAQALGKKEKEREAL